MVGSPRILTEDQGLVILKLTVGLGRYCAELQQGTVRGLSRGPTAPTGCYRVVKETAWVKIYILKTGQ